MSKRELKYFKNKRKAAEKKAREKAELQKEIDAREFLSLYMQYVKEQKKEEMKKSIVNWTVGKWDSALKKAGFRPKRRNQKIFMTKKQWNDYIMEKYAGDSNPWLTGRANYFQEKLKF